MKLSRRVWVLALAVGACGDSDGQELGDFTGTTGGATATSTSGRDTGAPATTNSSTTGSGVDTGGPVTPDAGATTGGTTGAQTTGSVTTTGIDLGPGTRPYGCGAVDFLFVIDNSASMAPHQDALIAAFPGWAANMQLLVPASGQSQLMVVKTDTGWGGHCMDQCDEMQMCLDDLEFDCSMTSVGCDAALGAGVTYPYGMSGSNLPCQLVGDARYVIPEEPDIVPPLTCMADVGVRTYSEPRTMDALVAALDTDQLGPGGCNDGFLRDDALLVVTILTDKRDDTSAGDPVSWYEAVVAAKNGRPEDVVVVGLFAEDLPSCSADAEQPVDLATFVDMFPNSTRLDACSSEYGEQLIQTVPLVGQACESMLEP